MPRFADSSPMPTLHELYSPGFLTERASDTPPEAAPTDTPALTYCPERHGRPADFVRHTDFGPFRARVERELATLSAFAAGAAPTVTNLAMCQSKLFDIDDAGNHLQYSEREAALMYGEVTRGLTQLSRLILDDRLSLASRRLELDQLAPQLTVCAGGAVEALHCCLGRLDPARNDLPGLFRSRVEQIVEQVAIDTVETEYADELSEARLAQRHYVAGLKRKLYDRLELPWRLPEDPFVHSHHEQPLVERCAASLVPRLAPEAIALLLAEDYLQRFTCALHQRIGSRGAARPSSLDARALPSPTVTQIQDCLQPLAEEFGPPPPSGALLREGEDGQCECLTDATLVAAYFLDVMGTADSLAASGEASTIAAWSEPLADDLPAARSCIRSRGDLVWVEDNGLRRPFDAEDLTRVPRGELRTSMVRTALLNSSPALLDRVRASSAWNEELQALWTETRTPPAASRPLPGRLSWTGAAGPQSLDPSQITGLFDQRGPGEPMPSALREGLSTLLALTLSLQKPESARRDGPPRTRTMLFVQPLRLWWYEVGSAMRADPPRLTGDELLEVLMTPTGDARPPLVQALTGSHQDLVHVLLEGLTELRRDGLLRGERLFERLAEPDAAPGGLPALLAEFNSNALGQLLRFALQPAGEDRLSAEACRALLLGPAQVPSTQAVPPLPLALIERALLSKTAAPPLQRYVEAAIQASQRKLLSREDLRQALGSLPAAATRMPESAQEWEAWKSAACSWYAGILKGWLKGEIPEEEAAAALAERVPSDGAEVPASAASPASASSADIWEARLNSNRIQVCAEPLRLGPPTPEAARERRLRRHMLDRLAGLTSDGRGLEGLEARQVQTPCRAIRSALDAGLWQEAAECARRLQTAMNSLAFSREDIAAAIGSALDGGTKPASPAMREAAN